MKKKLFRVMLTHCLNIVLLQFHLVSEEQPNFLEPEPAPCLVAVLKVKVKTPTKTTINELLHRQTDLAVSKILSRYKVQAPLK